MIALNYHNHHPILSLLSKIAWISYEISFPISFLVSMVVTYVLIPTAKKSELPVHAFFKPLPLIMHNANVLFMSIEFMTNQLPFNFWHFPFLVFYGMIYIVFSWIWHHYRGIYYYFFLDYERKDALLWYVGLLVFITMLFMGGYSCYHWQESARHSLLPNLAIVTLTAMASKYSDDKSNQNK